MRTDSIQGSLKEPLPNGKRAFYAVRVDPQLAESLRPECCGERGPIGRPRRNDLDVGRAGDIFYLIWTMSSGASGKAGN